MGKDNLEKFVRIVIRKGLDRGSVSAILAAKDYKDYLEINKNSITKFIDLTEEEYTLAKDIIEDFYDEQLKKYGKNN